MVSMDALYSQPRCAAHEAGSEAFRDCQTAVIVGNVDWPLLLQLLSVFSAHVAAVLPGERSPFFGEWYGRSRWLDLSDGCVLHAYLRPALGPLDFRGCLAHAGPQDFYGR